LASQTMASRPTIRLSSKPPTSIMLTYSILQLRARPRYSAAPADSVAFGKFLPLSLFRLLTSSLFLSPSGPHSTFLDHPSLALDASWSGRPMNVVVVSLRVGRLSAQHAANRPVPCSSKTPAPSRSTVLLSSAQLTPTPKSTKISVKTPLIKLPVVERSSAAARVRVPGGRRGP
jgi:hypothetical protein